MAICNSPVSVTTSSSSSHADSDLDFSIRKRFGGKGKAVADSSLETETEAAAAVLEAEKSVGEVGSGGDRGESGSQVVMNGENGVAEVAAKFAYRPCAPAHRKVKESPLSSDAIFRQSHAGLFNLCIVVLVAVNSRLIIENLMKYGWLIRAGFWFSSKSLRDWPLFMCCLTLPIFPLAAFVVEKLAQQKYISEQVVVSLHIIITTAAVLFPVLVILRCDSAVLSGVTLMLFACIVWLKLVSFAHTNYDMRAVAKLIDKGDDLSTSLNMDYPYDVNFKSLAYFMVAPTLCYQMLGVPISTVYPELLFREMQASQA